MSPFATWPRFPASSWDASIGLVLIVKWTIVLALAWLRMGFWPGGIRDGESRSGDGPL